MDILQRRPIFVVAACIVHENRVLLAQRWQPDVPSTHLRWEFPGGKVEFEEKPHHAIIREIKEELGADIIVMRFLPHLHSNVHESIDGIKYHAIVAAFECILAPDSPTPVPSEPGTANVCWVNRQEVKGLTVMPGVIEFLACMQGV